MNKNYPSTGPVIIELHTHGVSGTPPERILDVPNTTWIDGTNNSRFFTAMDDAGNPAPAAGLIGKVPRRRYGYYWGLMTSGTFRQALWMMLVPFAMGNTALYMLPPAGTTVTRGFLLITRGLVRVFCLYLSVLFTVQLTIVLADVLATQCIRNGKCRAIDAKPNAGTHWLSLHPLPLALLVGLVIAALIATLAAITRSSDPDPEQGDQPGGEKQNPPVGDQAILHAGLAANDFYNGSRTAPALRTLHGMAALSAASLVMTNGTPWPQGGSDLDVPAWFALTLLGIATGVCFAVDDPENTGGRFARGGRLGTLFRERTGAVWVTLAAGVFVYTVVFRLPAAIQHQFLDSNQKVVHQFPGSSNAITMVIYILSGLVIATALTVAIPATAARKVWVNGAPGITKRFPGVYVPWFHGFMALWMLVLGAFLGAGFGVGLASAAVNCYAAGCRPKFLAPADADHASVPKIYDALALEWGLVFVLTFVIGGAAFGIGVIRAARGADAVAMSLQGDSLWFRWYLARLNQVTHRIVAAFAIGAGLCAIVGWVAYYNFPKFVDTSNWEIHRLIAHHHDRLNSVSSVLRSSGLTILILGLVAFIALIYNAHRREATVGRGIAVLWDLAAFWPREGHPIVPPAYSQTAVPDVTKWVSKRLSENAEAKVILCAHSQGSTLFYAVVLRLAADGADLSRVGLLTYGSQLQWAYGRAFPAYLSYFSHLQVLTHLNNRWHNLIRFTDPIGGPVLSWRKSVLAAVDPNPNRVTAHALPGHSWDPGITVPSNRGHLQLGNEHWFADPPLTDPRYETLGHSNYLRDTSYWDAVITEMVTP